MLPFLDAAAPLAFAAAATWTDLRQRIVPDWLNTLALAAAIALCFQYGKLGPWNYLPYLVLLASSFLLAYALYRLGAWAGGDVKFFTALMAFYPLFRGFSAFTPVSVFIDSVIVLVPVAALAYLPRWVVELKGEVLAAAKESAIPSVLAALAYTPVYLALPFLGVSLSSNAPAYAVAFIALLLFKPPWWLSAGAFAAAAYSNAAGSLAAVAFSAVFFFAAGFCTRFYSKVIKRVLRVQVPVSKLKEGDIPAKTVFVSGGKAREWEPPSIGQVIASAGDVRSLGSLFSPPGRVVADSTKARGLEDAEIAELKRLGVKRLEVRESLPYVPVMACGYLVSMWWVLA